MTWTLKSPGIWVGNLEGFVIHKISDTKKPGKVIDQHGHREQIDVYLYTAVKPVRGEQPIKFVGYDIDKITEKILLQAVKTLF